MVKSSTSLALSASVSFLPFTALGGKLTRVPLQATSSFCGNSCVNVLFGGLGFGGWNLSAPLLLGRLLHMLGWRWSSQGHRVE